MSIGGGTDRVDAEQASPGAVEEAQIAVGVEHGDEIVEVVGEREARMTFEIDAHRALQFGDSEAKPSRRVLGGRPSADHGSWGSAFAAWSVAST